MNTIATYIHHIGPIIFDINGALALRWYGLAYVAGFILGYLVLLRLSRKGLYCVEESKLGDFITAVCVFGVLLGGRLGEFFFYWLPEKGLDGFLADPAWVLRVWEGGMASHGGIIGVFLVALWYSRKHKLSFPAVVDGLAIVAPIGLCFGRIANFINGELFGKIAPVDSAIAVKFPQECTTLPPDTFLPKVLEACEASGIEWVAPGQPGWFDWYLTAIRENETFREVVGQVLNPRYPSQLFEAFGEGLVIFVVLLVLRLKWKGAPAGIFSAGFAALYSIARITCECFKEPDAAVWCGVTQGQWLTISVIAMFAGFLWVALRNGKKQKNA